MAQKTSINIKPCNIGSSEAHNRRTAEYLAHIGSEKFYVRTDLMSDNETWVAPDFGDTSLSRTLQSDSRYGKGKRLVGRCRPKTGSV